MDKKNGLNHSDGKDFDNFIIDETNVSADEEELKPEAIDYLAMIIAAFQVLLPVVIVIVVVFWLFVKLFAGNF